jgi:hypothetical protein
VTATSIRSSGARPPLAPPPEHNLEKNGEWFVPVIRRLSFKIDEESKAYIIAESPDRDRRVGQRRPISMESKARHHLSTQNLPSLIERFPHQIPAAKRQQVEGILVKFERGAIVLQDVNEDRPSLLSPQAMRAWRRF